MWLKWKLRWPISCVLIVLQSLLLLFSIIYVLLFIIFISFNLLFIFRMQINEWIKQKKTFSLAGSKTSFPSAKKSSARSFYFDDLPRSPFPSI